MTDRSPYALVRSWATMRLISAECTGRGTLPPVTEATDDNLGHDPGDPAEAEWPRMCPLDLSTMSRAARLDVHRRLAARKVHFRMRRDELWVDASRLDDAYEVVEEVSVAAPGDDEPYDGNPFRREFVRGIGTPVARWQRLAGACIDGVVWGTMAWTAGRAGVPIALTTCGLLALTVGFLAALGATPGKLAVGACAVSVRDGRLPSVRAALLRATVPVALSLVTLVHPLLGIAAFLLSLGSLVLVLFAPDGRSVADLVAGTVVVQTESRPSAKRARRR